VPPRPDPPLLIRERPLSALSRYALLSATLLCALWSLYADLQRAEQPSLEDWRHVVTTLKPQLRRGDAVSWRPEWSEEGRVALKELEGEVEIIYPPHHGAWDLGRFERLWLISALGRSARELEAHSALDSAAAEEQARRDVVPEQALTVLEERSLGPLKLGLLRVEGPQVLADLYQELSDPQAVKFVLSGQRGSKPCELWALNGWHCRLKRPQLERSLRASASTRRLKLSELSDGEALRRCLERPAHERLKGRSKQRRLYTLDRRRHLPYIDCGLDPELHVSRDYRVIGGEPRRCVWLHPRQGRTLTLRWRVPSRVPSGGAELSLRYGWEDLAVDPPFRASRARPIELKLSLLSGGHAARELIRERLEPQVGWRALSSPLSDALSDAPARTSSAHEMSELLLELSAPKGDADAQLCVDLSLRSAQREKP